MRRLRVPVAGLRAGRWALPDEAAHHVTRVLRRGPGDELDLFDGARGVQASARIVEVGGEGVMVEVGEVREPAEGTRGRRAITLVQALGKADKLDRVVRDATELGATRIVPVVTRRTVVQPGDRGAARVERWRKIAVEAARQSGRVDAPEVDAIMPLDEIARGLEATCKLALTPGAQRHAGEVVLATALGESIAMIVGPEGGLDPDEVGALERAGWVPCTLGPQTLRTETVAGAVLGGLLLVAPTRTTMVR